jgi:thioredoxin 1
MNNVLKITNDNFEKKVMKANAPVVVDFWAPWCGPCKMLGPVIEELAVDFTGKVSVGKVNIEEEQALASDFKVMSIPTVMIFKDGKLVEKIMGFKQKEEFERILKNIL